MVTVELSLVRELLAVDDVLKAAGGWWTAGKGEFVKVLQADRTGDTLELRQSCSSRRASAPRGRCLPGGA